MRLCFSILLFCISSSIFAQDFSSYEKHYYDAPEVNVPYRYLRPLHQDLSVRYPLVIFLHGAYQKGFDNESQLAIGGRFFLRDSIRKNYAAYVLFPQCPVADLWAYFETSVDTATGKTNRIIFPFHKKPTDISNALMQLIDSLVRSDRIDTTRIYIAGLSQGGMGVLDLIARHPERFAAALSICGAGDVNTCKRFAGRVALWLFHGEQDNVVPVYFSRGYFKRLQKLKSDVRYSEYQNVQHDSWNNAFKEPEFMSWLFSKQKK